MISTTEDHLKSNVKKLLEYSMVWFIIDREAREIM